MEYERVLRESAGVLACLAIGAVNIKAMDKPWKILFILAVVYFVTFVLSYLITTFQAIMLLPLNNHQLYNLYMPVDTFLMCLPVRYFVAKTCTRNIISLLCLCFGVVYACQVERIGLSGFANYACVASNICILMTYGFFLYEVLHTFPMRQRPSKIWLCVGALLCSGCMVPYMSLIHYLNRLDRDMSALLFLIVDIFGNIRYVCLAVAFWMLGRGSHKPGNVFKA